MRARSRAQLLALSGVEVGEDLLEDRVQRALRGADESCFALGDLDDVASPVGALTSRRGQSGSSSC